MHRYLTHVPTVGSAFGGKVAYMSGMQEVSVTGIDDDENQRAKMRAPVEPTLLGVGSSHLACGLNNSVWFYAVNGRG